MKIQIAVVANGKDSGKPVVWTDETSGSRYGIGVLSIADEGPDFGPADQIPGTDYEGTPGRTAAQICADAVAMDRSQASKSFDHPEGFITPQQVAILSRFCSQWKDGPKINS
jgi:hypothetical protein